jgi:glycosyltransferase involved in cell wall biosynthesis
MKLHFLMQDTRALYGAERATLRLVSGLASAGAEVRVLLLDEARLDASVPSPLADAFRAIAPVETIPVSGRFSRAAVHRIRDILLAAGTGALLHSTGYKADVHAVLASRSSRLFPVVSTVHGWLFRRDLKERLFLAANLWALRRCSRVIVLSAFYENYLRRRGFTPLQLALIPTAFPADAVPPTPAADALWRDPDAPFTFGMLGRLSEEKDHDTFLRAAARLARLTSGAPRPWRLLIAGDGPLRDRIARRIARLGLTDRTTLAGPMDSADFFRRTHVLVQCSLVENQPMSVMEAMSWARPTIATRAGGLPEWITPPISTDAPDPESTGWLVPLRDPTALAATMHRCLLSPGLTQAIGLRARQRLLSSPDYPSMLRDHLGLYSALL